jgi:fatty-acyl-CoA synthase
VIIRGGENIYAAEVEDALLQHPAIADVAVVAQPDERWGEVPVAFFRVVPGHTARPVEVEAFARERLASFKVPRRWEQLDEFPLTASGKVKKFELQARLQGDADPAPA